MDVWYCSTAWFIDVERIRLGENHELDMLLVVFFKIQLQYKVFHILMLNWLLLRSQKKNRIPGIPKIPKVVGSSYFQIFPLKHYHHHLGIYIFIYIYIRLFILYIYIYIYKYYICILYSVYHLFVRLKSWNHRTIRVHSHCMKEHTMCVPCCHEKMWETQPMLLSISWVSLLILTFSIFFVDVRAVPRFVLMRPEQ